MNYLAACREMGFIRHSVAQTEYIVRRKQYQNGITYVYILNTIYYSMWKISKGDN